MAKVGVGFAIFGDGTEEEKVCFRSKVWCVIPENEGRNRKKLDFGSKRCGLVKTIKNWDPIF